MTEQEIVERCRRGDRRAQRALYDLGADRVYRLALRMTRNADDALDVAQDTFLRAFTRIGQFRGQAGLTTWLYRIAVNEALQLLRRRKEQARKLRQVPVETEQPPETSATSRRLDVETALDRLTDNDRAILLLRYQEGLDYREIAEALECEPGTVASRLNRARGRLRALLTANEGPKEETGPAEHQTR